MQKIIFVCGSNGAGKSTLTRTLARLENLLVIDPDKLAADGLSPIEAGKASIKMARLFIEQKISFIRESTLSSNFDFNLMQEARQNGYRIELIYICISSPKLALDRIAMRKARGGHDVPAKDVYRRYERSVANLGKAIKMADKVTIMDNSNGNMKRIY